MFQKGHKKLPNAGPNFQPGHDPRRSLVGRPANDVVVADIKSDIKTKLAIFFQRYFELPFDEMQKIIDSKTLTVGEMIAVKFLKLAGEQGTPAQIECICRIFGLQVPDKVQVNVTVSVEDLVAKANAIETTAIRIEKKETDD